MNFLVALVEFFFFYMEANQTLENDELTPEVVVDSPNDKFETNSVEIGSSKASINILTNKTNSTFWRGKYFFFMI